MVDKIDKLIEPIRHSLYINDHPTHVVHQKRLKTNTITTKMKVDDDKSTGSCHADKNEIKGNTYFLYIVNNPPGALMK